QLQRELLRPRDSAEYYGSWRNILRRNPAPHAPDQLSFDRERFRRCAAGQHYRVGAAQRSQRLPQASRWQQPIGCVLWRHQHDVEVPGEGTMLKAVVKQVQLRAESRFSEAPGFIAV